MTDMRRSHPVVHLELHTSDLAQARSLDSGLLGRRSERVDTDCGSYLALELGGRLGGGIVECDTPHAVWLPYMALRSQRMIASRADAS
jgi:hypothetical protein